MRDTLLLTAVVYLTGVEFALPILLIRHELRDRKDDPPITNIRDGLRLGLLQLSSMVRVAFCWPYHVVEFCVEHTERAR